MKRLILISAPALRRLLASTGIVAAAVLASAPAGRSAPVHLVDEAPVAITTVAPGIHLVDFGRVAFGNLRLAPPTGATGKIPTPRGPVEIDWKRGATFQLSLTLPPGMSAKLELPATENSQGVAVNGQRVRAVRAGSRWLVEADAKGRATIEVR